MYMDFASSVYKAHIDSGRLHINAMSIHIRRFLHRIAMSYRSCIDSIWMSYRCIWISHRAYIKRMSILIGCIPVPCRFIYVVYKFYIDVISTLYRFYMDVISLCMDLTSSVYKAHIDSDRLYISAMSIHIRRL